MWTVTYRIRPEIAGFCIAGYVLIAFNITFWRTLLSAVAPNSVYEWLFIGAVLIEALCILNLFIGLFVVPYIYAPAMTALLIATAGVAYFASAYGVIVDLSMIRSVFETDRKEAVDLITPGLIAFIFGFGILPAALVWLVRIEYRSFWRELSVRGLATLGVTAVMAVTAMLFMQNITSVFREHRILLYMFTPLNYLYATRAYLRGHSKINSGRLDQFGVDAMRVPRDGTRTLTVLVIGETARAANFSLIRYERPTNPQLSRVSGLVALSNVQSCGTDTAQSVPCMFSGMRRANYTYERAMQREGLLDILQRVGLSVLWRENQSGCKGVCARVPTEFVTTMQHRRFYELGNSFDENLLTGLQERIDQFQSDAVVVLHMMGSHGPAYYQRYPTAFEQFRPACKEAQFSRCTQQEIINSYDNSILYTDHILFRLVEMLRAKDREGLATAMLFVSDHGESLGEGNLYLHGMPYLFAPAEQKHVPMLLWLSPLFQSKSQIDMGCMKANKDQAVSHDHFFHSVLGLLDVRTRVYDKNLDIFGQCRTSGDRE